MLLVVDANTVFSALLTRGKTLEVFILNRRHKKFELVAPEFMFLEIDRRFDEILERSGLRREELAKVFKEVKGAIEFVPFEEFNERAEEAEKLAPHSKDVQYFALALAFRCGIWSKEKSFREQPKIEIFSTRKLLSDLLGTS